ncbi:MAG: carbon starvation protein A [Verrucomicrobiaceae bacterium]|nr:carbon starvation protein A [Verrucomicrobiaceae bacterium]
METLLIAVGSLVFYLIAYHTYGKWLGRKIFKLDPDALVPSLALNDNKDFVPTKKAVIFGHHFTSIAGTGPVVGPALAVIWGWVPALIWVLLGSVLIGAVHDFGSLVVSIRNRGQTVGDIAGRVLAPRTRILFLSILFLALTMVLAIFGLVIAAVFKQYPASIFPCLFQTPLAILIGVFLHRRGVNLLIPSMITLGVMYLTVIYGDVGFLGELNNTLAALPTMHWVAFLLAYSYLASVLPVWVLLQPRDFINSLQLLSALGMVVIGLIVAGLIGGAPIVEGGARPALEIVAPAVRLSPEGAPWMFPFLFITIACGAISGFHCLVSSGTSSKQIARETDAQFVGFGSMLTEGFLAVLVILSCVAGIGLGIAGDGGAVLSGTAAYATRYGSWDGASGLAAMLGAFVEGSANFLQAMGLGTAFAVALMGVFVASFAATTMDTACRLQRYVTQELAAAVKFKPLTNKHAATVFAVAIAGIIAALPVGDQIGQSWDWNTAGKGGLILWPLFGAVNQLLGGLAFLVIAFWMWRRKLSVWFVVIPMIFMLVLPGYAMALSIFGPDGYLQTARETGQWTLAIFGIATIALEIWMIVEALIAWPKAKGVLEEQLAPLPRPVGLSESGGLS